jgi:hypothetical protein
MPRSDNDKILKVINNILNKNSLEVSDYNKFIETKKKYNLNLNDIMGDEIAWKMETFERRLSEIAKKENGYDSWFDSEQWDS